MTHSETIRVDLGFRSYDICVCSGILNTGFAQQFTPFELPRAIVVTDTNVGELYLENFCQKLRSRVDTVDSVTVPAGESTKSAAQLSELWDQFLHLNADRNTAILALGGGVVGDLAGFAAASFARGLPFIQVPTSLLAQVDSSVGGKTGINLAGAKNMAGAFWQPAFVMIDPTTLNTLDNENFTSGLAEVVKYGMIMDSEFFSWLEENASGICQKDPSVLTTMIAQCCRLKAQIVAEDETETTGRRAILNYGHTFGHAIENVFGYGTYLHGHAIAIGMQCAAWLAKELGMLDEKSMQRQQQLLAALGCPLTVLSGKESELVSAMHRDKKVQRGILRLILPDKMGNVQLVDSPDDQWLTRAFLANSHDH